MLFIPVKLNTLSINTQIRVYASSVMKETCCQTGFLKKWQFKVAANKELDPLYLLYRDGIIFGCMVNLTVQYAMAYNVCSFSMTYCPHSFQ